jgi:hypothetical protein
MITDKEKLLWWLLDAGAKGEPYTLSGNHIYQHAQGYPSPVQREEVDRTLIVRLQHRGILDNNLQPTMKAKREYYANS